MCKYGKSTNEPAGNKAVLICFAIFFSPVTLATSRQKSAEVCSTRISLSHLTYAHGNIWPVVECMLRRLFFAVNKIRLLASLISFNLGHGRCFFFKFTGQGKILHYSLFNSQKLNVVDRQFQNYKGLLLSTLEKMYSICTIPQSQ